MTRFLVLALLAAAVSAGGCSSLSLTGAGLLNPLGSRQAPPPADPNAPQVLMEIRPAKGRPQKLHAPLTEPISVQQAIDEAGVSSRFRRIRVTIFRPNQDGSFARLGVKYDKKKGRIDTASDYLLHPGDHIVVEQDTSTVVDDMMAPLLGPLANSASIFSP